MITNDEVKSEIEKLPLSQDLLQYYKDKLGIIITLNLYSDPFF